MKIRPAIPQDLEHLIEFNASMALETEAKTLSPDKLRPGVSAVLNDPLKGFYVVAEQDGSIIGGLMVTFEWSDWRNAWFWWIQSVYVVAEARNKGIYSKLYEFVRSLADDRGDVCGFRLYVEKDNVGAQHVYEKCGMKQSEYLMFESQ